MTADPITCVHIGRSTWQGPASAAPRKDDRMSDLRLSWMRDEEGVIAIYATDGKGRTVAVADFWTGPLRQHMGINREAAKIIQQQLAETLVENWNGPAKGDYHEGIEEGWSAGAAQERTIWTRAIEAYFDATAVMDVEKYAEEIRKGIEGE